MKCCQSPETTDIGREKNKKPHIVAIPSSPLVINCILLRALLCTLGERVSTTFPSSQHLRPRVCQPLSSETSTLRQRENQTRGRRERKRLQRCSGLGSGSGLKPASLFASLDKGGGPVSSSAGTRWWLGRQKGPTVVTGSEEATDSHLRISLNDGAANPLFTRSDQPPHPHPNTTASPPSGFEFFWQSKVEKSFLVIDFPQGAARYIAKGPVIFYHQGKGRSHSGVSSVSSAHVEGSCTSELLPMHEIQVSLSNSPQGTGGMSLSSATWLSPLFPLAPAMWKKIRLFLQIEADSKRCCFSKILKDLFPGSERELPSLHLLSPQPLPFVVLYTGSSPLHWSHACLILGINCKTSWEVVISITGLLRCQARGREISVQIFPLTLISCVVYLV